MSWIGGWPMPTRRWPRTTRAIAESGAESVQPASVPAARASGTVLLVEDQPDVRRLADVILTNPPFVGREEDGIESNFPAHFRTRETADLFLALIIRLLKPGGRAAVVLPDGSLFGEGVKTRIKEKLLGEFNLHTIVRLPNGVFNPYTGIRTNLLFFT